MPDPRADAEPLPAAVPGVALPDDDTGPIALPARPAGSRRPRAARPAALPPARAVAGAAVAVAGVALGIGTLLWATDAPAGDPVVRPAADSDLSEPAVALPDDGAPVEIETAPVDPPPVVVPPPAAPPVPPAATAAAAPAQPSVEEVPVLVLNNSRIEGLAARAAATFERGGWPVRDTGSLRGRIRATTVYYPPGQQDVARAFAERFPGVERVLPRLAGLPGTGLTVVVTRDFRP